LRIEINDFVGKDRIDDFNPLEMRCLANPAFKKAFGSPLVFFDIDKYLSHNRNINLTF
jgi:hypothetical protein